MTSEEVKPVAGVDVIVVVSEEAIVVVDMPVEVISLCESLELNVGRKGERGERRNASEYTGLIS